MTTTSVGGQDLLYLIPLMVLVSVLFIAAAYFLGVRGGRKLEQIEHQAQEGKKNEEAVNKTPKLASNSASDEANNGSTRRRRFGGQAPVTSEEDREQTRLGKPRYDDSEKRRRPS